MKTYFDLPTSAIESQDVTVEIVINETPVKFEADLSELIIDTETIRIELDLSKVDDEDILERAAEILENEKSCLSPDTVANIEYALDPDGHNFKPETIEDILKIEVLKKAYEKYTILQLEEILKL